MLSNIKNGRLDKTVKIGIWPANGSGIYNLLEQSAKFGILEHTNGVMILGGRMGQDWIFKA